MAQMYIGHSRFLEIIIGLYFVAMGCSPKPTAELSRRPLQAIIENDRTLSVHGELKITEKTIIDKEVILYPEAFIVTTGSGEVIFNKRVTILGESQVFDEKCKLTFSPYVIGYLNPNWFGAKEYDEEDDTEAFLKMAELFAESYASLEFEIPIGKYYISQTLRIDSRTIHKKSFVMRGKSKSSSSVKGSSLIWRGEPDKTMLTMENVNESYIFNIDFTAQEGHFLKHNVMIKPFSYQIKFENCGFAGCAGNTAANVNLNAGNNLQVSEIYFENCMFRGYNRPDLKTETASGVIGGFGNTINFYFEFCSLIGYSKSAIDIHNSSVFSVSNSTFGHNNMDITCAACNSFIHSNYSEESKGFFMASSLTHLTSTVLMNNYFTGDPIDGYVVRDGSGSLLLLNNTFGGTDADADRNMIKWEDIEHNPIISLGNFFKNASQNNLPFFNRSNVINTRQIFSRGDRGGLNADGRKEIKGIN